MQPFRKYGWSKLARWRRSLKCTEVGVKSVTTHRIGTFIHKYIPDICANNFAAGSYWSEEVYSRLLPFENGKLHFRITCHVLTPKLEEGSSWRVHFGVVWKSIPTFPIAVNWGYTDIRPFSHKLTKYSEQTRFFVAEVTWRKLMGHGHVIQQINPFSFIFWNQNIETFQRH